MCTQAVNKPTRLDKFSEHSEKYQNNKKTVSNVNDELKQENTVQWPLRLSSNQLLEIRHFCLTKLGYAGYTIKRSKKQAIIT